MSRIIFTSFTFPALLLVAAACQPRTGGSAVGPAAPTGLAPETVVGRIDGEPITAAEVDSKVKGAIVRADIEHLEKVHDLRAEALEELIDRRLVEKEAKKQGVTADALVAREVDAKLEEPSEEALKGLYQQAVDSGQNLPPFENVRGEVAKFVKDRQKKEKLDEFHAGLREKAKIETLLPSPDLPRIEVDASGPSRGPADAKVTIVEFSDYECPFCHKAEATVKEIMESYAGKVRLVYREFPLAGHRHAQKASEAALCAGDQGKYWEMHDKLFSVEELEVASLKGYAKELGLDGAKFDSCLDDNTKKDQVATSIKAGEEVGVSGTPAFFINGRMITGAVPIEKFKEVIDAELAGPARN